VTAASPDVARLFVRREIEEFPYREAELLDERRYEEWLDLFTEDARYFGGWKIARRKIILDQSVLLAKNLTFFF
jgi:3-phenylpropionate/cinnamic acid dioxygenase small subunit